MGDELKLIETLWEQQATSPNDASKLCRSLLHIHEYCGTALAVVELATTRELDQTSIIYLSTGLIF